jgi:hypothetical protein
MIKASHLPVAFTDLLAAAQWFKTVLKLSPLADVFGPGKLVIEFEQLCKSSH